MVNLVGIKLRVARRSSSFKKGIDTILMTLSIQNRE